MTWDKKHSSKQVASITCTLGKKFQFFYHNNINYMCTLITNYSGVLNTRGSLNNSFGGEGGGSEKFKIINKWGGLIKWRGGVGKYN